MTANVGTIDRILRAALGVVLLYLAFFSGLPLFDAVLIQIVAAVIGIVMLATATMRSCPLYAMLGINTCKAR